MIAISLPHLVTLRCLAFPFGNPSKVCGLSSATAHSACWAALRAATCENNNLVLLSLSGFPLVGHTKLTT